MAKAAAAARFKGKNASTLDVLAPAGLGVHEAVYLLALKPMMGAAVAILAIMFRGMQVGMDLGSS